MAAIAFPSFTSLLRRGRELHGSMYRGYRVHLFLNNKSRRSLSRQFSVKQVQLCRHYSTGTTSKHINNASSDFLRDKKIVPESDPPSTTDVNLLYQFIDNSHKLMVLTGAGVSTECGIPDYRSPNGAYSSGFKPITHQEFVRSSRARKRYWARSFAGWRRFTAAKPGPTHTSLASLENRNVFQDQVKALNPKWASAIESLDSGSPGSNKSFGMQQRPDGDIEIDEKYWEEDFFIPNCQRCNGVLKPDVVFFGDNLPKDRAAKAMEAAKECDALLVLGSSLMTMSAFRLVRAAHEAGAATAIVNIGVTRADDFVPLKINAVCGEILPRLLNMGCLTIPAVVQ